MLANFFAVCTLYVKHLLEYVKFKHSNDTTIYKKNNRNVKKCSIINLMINTKILIFNNTKILD